MKVQAFNVTSLLDIRVPTTTRSISEETRKEILDNVQPGDVILETNNAYPNWQRLERLAFRSSFTHAAIFEGWKDGKPMLLEATTGDPSGAGVIRTNLEEYFHGPVKLAVVRPDYKTPADRDAALDYARAQLGRPYDTGFNYKDDNSFFCSELVDKSLRACPNPIQAQTSRALGFGRETIAPDAFLRLPNARHFGDKPNFYANMASHWPIALSTVGGAAAGYALGGLAGGAVGLATGLFGSICVGNKIQTGHFNLAGGHK